MNVNTFLMNVLLRESLFCTPFYGIIKFLTYMYTTDRGPRKELAKLSQELLIACATCENYELF